MYYKDAILSSGGGGMTLENLQCPACGSRELQEIDVDTFKCPYCGTSFVLNKRDKNIIEYKKTIKKLEAENERLRMKYEDADKERKILIPRTLANFFSRDSEFALYIMFVGIVFLGALAYWGGRYAIHLFNVRSLEKNVVEIQQDIDEGRYGEALVKTESIRGDNYDKEDTKRWESTRKELINQIEKEEAKANNYTLIAMPERSARYVDEPYESVVSNLTSAGFTNIVVKEADQKAGLFHSAKDVKEISVRGAMSFEKGEEFPSDAEIIIYYYPE